MPVLPPADYINWVRRSLNRLGDCGLPENGKVDDDYEGFVSGFQAYEGITSDGVVGPNTQNHLIWANILSREYCDWIREVIKKDLPGTKTGSGPWMKPVDHDAVRAYQTEFGPKNGGLQADGWVGPHTEYVMLKRSKKKIPPKSTDPPLPIEFDIDHPVIGFAPLDEVEIQAIVAVVTGDQSRIDWEQFRKMSKQMGTALMRWGAGVPGAVIPSVFDINDAFTIPDKAVAQAEALKGMSYGLVDHAFHRVRRNSELSPTVVPGIDSDGFRAGYRAMQRHLVKIHSRTNPHAKRVLERIKKEPDKVRLLFHIYRSLFKAFGRKGALGSGHANVAREMQRFCKFTYPTMKVITGHRADTLR